MRIPISITIDKQLLSQVDTAAEKAVLTRSAMIERCILSTLQEQHAAAQAFSNPAVREAFLDVMSRPEVIRGISVALGAEHAVAAVQPYLDFINAQKNKNKRSRASKSAPRAAQRRKK